MKTSSDLLKDIYKEYQERLNSGAAKTCNSFNISTFIEKYGYSQSTINNLLDELESYGYINRWIIDAFELIVED